MAPVAVTTGDGGPGRTARGNLLAINDFHGAIDPPTGSGGLVDGVPAGGVEYLATYVKRLRAEARREHRDSITVGVGDLVGGSPLTSAAFHDEPAVELMDSLGMQISSVGNHEFDEGVAELLRLQRGGCHPTDGCADGDGFRGARFQYLAANVVQRRSGLPLLPPVSVRLVDGVPVGFVGVTLAGTPHIVNPSGISTVEFRDEAETANRWAVLLRAAGIRSLVLLLHQGGQQNDPSGTPDPSGCANFTGDVTPIVAKLRPEYGIVVTGHTHQFYSCALPNSSGTSVVTSAGVNGQLVTDIDFTIDRATRRFASIQARNVIVANGVRAADGSWQVDGAGVPLRDAGLVDPAAARIADKYRAAVAPLAGRVVGRITADIGRTPGANGQTPLGDVVADAQLAWTRAQGAQIAFTNLGGLRTALSYADSAAGEQPGEVTYGEAFGAQPFNNLVVTVTLRGDQLKELLEQQFLGYRGQFRDRPLQVSAGFTYGYDMRRPLGQRVSDLALGGVPIDPATSYRVTASNFLVDGGDAMTVFGEGTDRTTAAGFDIDALVAYLGAGPVAPGHADRVTRLG
ncbi:bifunctional metallophosphatase/5'-nucleotidase [Micromonospora marina]|uniref:bifunctional metallophosphatase/5'-nucleotidase n=1 Tax=Micromonospora marina TaxID=307120 RepID=UPI003454F3D9